MITRHVFAIVTGTIVTLGLLYLMNFLIESGEKAEVEPRKGGTVEFVRLVIDTPTIIKELTPPKPPPPEPVPPRPNQETEEFDPNTKTTNILPRPDGSRHELPTPTTNPVDRDYLPFVRVAPVYPARAIAKGIEGYVDMEFTVSRTGTVVDPVVIFSSSVLFDKAAERAVLKFKYKPRVVDGVAIAVPGVTTRFTFNLEQ